MRIIFMGAADLSCDCLSALLDDGQHEVVAVVTQPDRPRGRNLKVYPCIVKTLAEQRGVPVMTPTKANTPESIEAIREYSPDIIVLVAYGQILTSALLELPPKGCVNMHYSLLPKYRGAAPIQWAVANGESVSGVTAMYMSKGMDEGDIIAQVETPIENEDTAGTLHDRLSILGAELAVRVMSDIGNGVISRTEQKHDDASYASKLKKTDGRIDWTRPAEEIYNHVRGFNPWPGCFCRLPGGATLRIHRCRVEPGGGHPGQVMEAGRDGPSIAAGKGSVRLLEVQPEGRRVMSGEAYLCGHGLKTGDRLE